MIKSVLLLCFTVSSAASSFAPVEKQSPFFIKYSNDWKQPPVKLSKTTSFMALRDSTGNVKLFPGAGNADKSLLEKKQTLPLGEKEFTSVYSIESGKYKISSSWSVTKNTLNPEKGPASHFTFSLQW